MKERQKVFEIGEPVYFNPGKPGLSVYGKIVGNPVMVGENLNWPVELDERLWTENQDILISVMLVYSEYITSYGKNKV